MKPFLTMLTILVMIAAALFYRQVWALISGMSVLESLNTIVTFLLHVAVATIVGYVAMTLPEFIKPWLRAFRWKHRAIRRGRVAPMDARQERIPRMASLKDQALAWLLSQMAAPSALTGTSPKRRTRLGEENQEEPTIRLDL